MPNTHFMTEKFSLKHLFDIYLQEIQKLLEPSLSPLERKKWENYQHSFVVIKEASLFELARYALSFGKDLSGKKLQIHHAIPVLTGRQVSNPQPIDLQYAKILHAYIQSLQENKHNIKEWTIRWLITSPISPLTKFFDREVNRLIVDTERNITWYQGQF